MESVLIIGVALLGSIFCSGIEMAFITVNKYKIRHLAEVGNVKAILVNKMLSKPESFLGTTLVGNNVFVVTVSIVADNLAMAYFPNKGMLISTVLVTLVILFFGEILPKAIFRKYAEKIMLRCAWFLEVIILMLYPFTKVILGISRTIARMIGHDFTFKKSFISREEIKFIAKHSENLDEQDREQAVMIDRAMNFNKIKLQDIMIPIDKAVMLDIDSTVEEALELTKKHHFSRIPVYDKKKEKVKGLINIYDILFNRKDGVTDIKAYLRQPYSLYKTESIGRALNRLKDSRRPLAFIIDNDKEVHGIVTLEDIIRKIVGPIEV